MLAIVAAILFGLALLFNLTETHLGDMSILDLELAGLMCFALPPPGHHGRSSDIPSGRFRSGGSVRAMPSRRGGIATSGGVGHARYSWPRWIPTACSRWTPRTPARTR
jgi:hypothetical protein